MQEPLGVVEPGKLIITGLCKNRIPEQKTQKKT